jgi:hypothetical protein
MPENQGENRSMNKAKYIYKDKDLTTLILSKVEHVIGLIAEQNGKTFDESYPEFISSKTYRNLVNTNTLLWSESAEYILDDYNIENANRCCESIV